MTYGPVGNKPLSTLQQGFARLFWDEFVFLQVAEDSALTI